MKTLGISIGMGRSIGRSKTDVMKKLLFLLCFLPATGYSQTRADYESVMTKIVKYFNARQADSICSLSKRKNFWTAANNEYFYKYGTINSFKYLGVDTSDNGKVHVFKVIWSNAGVKATSFSLGPDLKFWTFRLVTSSDEIERMLVRDKK